MNEITEIHFYRKQTIEMIRLCIVELDKVFESISFFFNSKFLKNDCHEYLFKKKHSVYFYGGQMFVLIPFVSIKGYRYNSQHSGGSFPFKTDTSFLRSCFLRLGVIKDSDTFNEFIFKHIYPDIQNRLTISNQFFNECFNIHFDDLELIKILEYLSEMVVEFSEFADLFLPTIGFSKKDTNYIHLKYREFFKKNNCEIFTSDKLKKEEKSISIKI